MLEPGQRWDTQARGRTLSATIRIQVGLVGFVDNATDERGPPRSGFQSYSVSYQSSLAVTLHTLLVIFTRQGVPTTRFHTLTSLSLAPDASVETLALPFITMRRRHKTTTVLRTTRSSSGCAAAARLLCWFQQGDSARWLQCFRE